MMQNLLDGLKVYDVTDFGAYPSDRLMTEPIQAAIDACHANGGGEVRVPEGVFRTGGLDLRSGVYLHLLSGAELEGSRDPADYTGPERRWMHALVKAYDSEHLGIIGEPYSCLNGMNCYNPDGEEKYRGPHGVLLKNCRDITLYGYGIRDCGNWGHAIFNCTKLSIRQVKVTGGHDGIDIHCCTETVIENCQLHTGDDAIAGFGNEGCVIRDCVLSSSCSAVRFGGADCLFERCSVPYPSTFGFRGSLPMADRQLSLNNGAHSRHGTGNLFLYYCDRRWELSHHYPGNIVFRDCVVDHPGCIFNLNFNGRNQWCCYRPLASITFERCTIRGVERPMNIHGDPDTPVDVTFRDCVIAAAEGESAQKAVANAFNFRSLRFENTCIEGYAEPTVITRSQGEVVTAGSTPLVCRYQPNPDDVIFTLEEIRAKVAALPSDEAAWQEWTATLPEADEADWNGEYGMYRPHGEKLGNDAWTSAMAVLRGTAGEHMARIARSCVAHYGYFVDADQEHKGLVRRDFGAGGVSSQLAAGPFFLALYLDTPLTGRAFLTDFLRSAVCLPAAVAGVKEALEKIQ